VKKIIGGIVATIVTLVFAITYQVSGASAGHDDDKATTPTSETSTPAPPATAPPPMTQKPSPGTPSVTASPRTTPASRAKLRRAS